MTKFIEIHVTKDMKKKAREAAKAIPKDETSGDSVRNGAGTEVGMIGELALLEYFKLKGMKATWDGDSEYDIMCQGLKYEVKTKECKMEPYQNYECSVSNFNAEQKCDFYVFVRVTEYTAFIVGYMRPAEYKEKARFIPKGTKFGNMQRGEFSCDAYNMYISDINSLPPIDRNEYKKNAN